MLLQVSYHEAGPSRDDSNTLMTSDVSVPLKTLLPGRNYTVTVSAVSRGVESNESVFSVPTRPLAPVLLSALAGERALRLAWRSDVNSRQDAYELRYRRRGEPDDAYRTVSSPPRGRRPAAPPPRPLTPLTRSCCSSRRRTRVPRSRTCSRAPCTRSKWPLSAMDYAVNGTPCSNLSVSDPHSGKRYSLHCINLLIYKYVRVTSGM